MLYDDPVLVARHFQYKFELKEVIIDGPLRKKNYSIRIECRQEASSYSHSFIWTFNASNTHKAAGYIEFIEKTINIQLTDQLNDQAFWFS